MCNAAHPRQREDDAPSFSLRISPPASQPSPPSQLIKFSDATSAESSLTVAEGYKTPEKEKEIMEELMEKCYHWMTHLKQTKDCTNEYDTIFVLKHEANFEGLRHHFMSLMPKQHVETTVVNAHCKILNQINGRRFQEQIYCVPADIAMFMLGNHGEKYMDLNRMDVDQYAHYHRFLDKRKLASHPFLFVPICNGGHQWLWIVDVQKKTFYALDPVNKKKEEIPGLRIKLNKFGLIVSQMRVYAGAEPLIEDGKGEEAEYIRLNCQRTRLISYNEIDAFRREYGPNILLHKINKIRDQMIRASEVIRLSEPSIALSNPFCKFTSADTDSK
ncbi:hypothetical protein Ahy_A06g028256 [Arachis hypogaea]|uniref:Ubiquitin-like protease family profile domain-containing protein n=1 Tax=Arachis hypogaea TaxID=3818 RepID=A0A445CQM6_ARAHY|nr:hypothetical protein Ahy_A06g028256 [Arachis hypogaea]